ncbi:chromosome transmission fidelity protein 8 homolog [Glandiceps talaboti]
MVQLLIKSIGSGASKEWLMVELQGRIMSRHDEDLSGNLIGDLHFNKKGIPILIIGHHILYGKLVDLEKPYLVLIKDENQASSDDVTMETDHSNKTKHFTVTAIIKRKLQFRTRPKPIISNVMKKV